MGRDKFLSQVVLTCWEASMSMRSSFSKTGSLSGDEASAGITTTGLMCSDRAEARRKLGGFLRGKTHPQTVSLTRPTSLSESTLDLAAPRV